MNPRDPTSIRYEAVGNLIFVALSAALTASGWNSTAGRMLVDLPRHPPEGTAKPQSRARPWNQQQVAERSARLDAPVITVPHFGVGVRTGHTAVRDVPVGPGRCRRRPTRPGQLGSIGQGSQAGHVHLPSECSEPVVNRPPPQGEVRGDGPRIGRSAPMWRVAIVVGRRGACHNGDSSSGRPPLSVRPESRRRSPPQSRSRGRKTPTCRRLPSRLSTIGSRKTIQPGRT